MKSARKFAGRVLLGALLASQGLWADANAPKPPPWEKFGEDDGISVYRREEPGSPVVALRGEGVVDAPILRVASVIADPKRATEWIDKLVENKTVRKLGDDEYVEWDHIKTPPVLTDRDFVFAIKLELHPKEKQVSFNYHSVYDSGAPKTDYVRGEFKFGTFLLTSIDGGKKTRVLAEVLADPKGSVPKWIVNMFQSGWPHETIVRLRAQVAKPDIKDEPRIKEKLTQAGF